MADGGVDLGVDFGPALGGDSLQQWEEGRRNRLLLLPDFFGRAGPGPGDNAGFFLQGDEPAFLERFGQAAGLGKTEGVGTSRSEQWTSNVALDNAEAGGKVGLLS